MPESDLLLVLPIPFSMYEGRVLLEAQSFNGLERWADNFESIVLALAAVPYDPVEGKTRSPRRDLATAACIDRVEIVPLPHPRSLWDFLKAYRSTRRLLGEWIGRCRYLHFAVGGVLWDWAAVAAAEAFRQGRPYSMFADCVHHEALLHATANLPWLRRARQRVMVSVLKRQRERIIQRCTLGLWHGHDCYSAYQGLCPNSHLVHDVHTKPSDSMPEPECAEKARRALAEPVLRICYAGRLIPIKAPLDWVRAIARARELGARVDATWIGDGPCRDEAAALAEQLGVADCIHLPGFTSDRSALLAALRSAHVLAFTHIARESPRCLVEALVSGTPIAGYESDYAKELVGELGGGELVPVHDWRALGERLAELDRDRARLAALIERAGANGRRFNDEAVFRERSQLMKRYL
ncbi:MAG: glycosyltransferase [Candidatus Hydrogenedentes bacterium]|nr:glycosyltransferase [Candidatus Hydrogenedentota bacterium]